MIVSPLMHKQVHSSEWVSEWVRRLTGGEAGPLVTACELNVEVGDQRMDVVIPLHLQAEWWGEGQVLQLYCVDVHLLKTTKQEHQTKVGKFQNFYFRVTPP